MNHDRSIQECMEAMEEYTPIDLRSPGEYELNHIPGAVNIPLFNNEERAEIGTIYKQVGQKEARWRAMEIVSPKLPSILGEIKKISESGKKPLLYCWRGGMRSRTTALFAELSGLVVFRIEGGYRAYREYIVNLIPSLIPEKAIIIDGMTGTGKTKILHQLKQLGYPVLDLERYANHRGSIFGAITGETPHNQKMFDSLLAEDLMKMKGSPYFIMEGESKRIGHAVQPPELYEKKEKGMHIRVSCSLETRVERIYEEYVNGAKDPEMFHEKAGEALKRILKRVKPADIQQELLMHLEEKNYKEMTRLLMVYYYDPRYANKISEYTGIFKEVDSESIDNAIQEIISIIENEC